MSLGMLQCLMNSILWLHTRLSQNSLALQPSCDHDLASSSSMRSWIIDFFAAKKGNSTPLLPRRISDGPAGTLRALKHGPSCFQVTDDTWKGPG